MHAERVTGEPQAVRWVVPSGRLACGRVAGAPGRLGELLADGTLTGGLAERSAVWLWLRDELSWREQGGRVADALRAALDDPAGWVIEDDAGEVLQRVTTDLLDGPVGEFVRSHGGTVSVQRAGEVVTVRLGGACEHCSAAGQTLRRRLLGELRQRCPELAELDGAGGTLRLTLAARG